MKLVELQTAFAQALRQPGTTPPTDGAPDFDERFDAYRNNAWQFFATALEQTYPVVLQRVGEGFFRQLAREYRADHPSRRGDLHWVGEPFAAWLARRMAGSGYEWLADLAQLEWAVADASVAATSPATELDSLAGFDPESLADLRLALQPSVRLVASSFPVWSVWQANQQEDPAPIDLASGPELCVVACVDEQPVLFRIAEVDYEVIRELMQGSTFGAALEATGANPEVLGRVLGWAFTERLVAAVVSPSGPA